MGKRFGIFLLLFSLVPAIGLAGGEIGPYGPGFVQGEGTFFQISGSCYLDVSLTASIPVTAQITSGLGKVSVCVEAIEPAAEVTLAIRGLVPGKTYHRYLDGLSNHQVITADTEGGWSITLGAGGGHHLILQENPSTIFLCDSPFVDGAGATHPAGWSDSVGADLNGTVGSWDPLTRTALLLTDLSQTIEIKSSYLILDGGGHTISDPVLGPLGGLVGIYQADQSNNTIANFRLVNLGEGVQIYRGRRNIIRGNTFQRNCVGVDLLYATSSNIVQGNTILVEGLGADPFRWAQGIYIGVFTAGNMIRDNEIRSVPGFGLYGIGCLGISPGNTISGNTVSGFKTGFNIPSSGNTLTENLITGNEVGLSLAGGSITIWQSSVYRNNFIGNGVQAYNLHSLGFFSLPLPVGGNHWSDWTGPDADGDGFVDLPYVIHELPGYPALTTLDDLPFARMDGWVTNKPPVFAPLGSFTVSEYETVQFTVSATDPEGGAVTLTSGSLPTGAAFDPATGVFTWLPIGGQTGVYTLSFFAGDSGTPPMTAQLDVVITVGEVTSPTLVVDIIIQEVLALGLPKEDVENSYLASLKKVNGFIEDGKVGAARNQVLAFITKVEQDVAQGKITADLGARLIAMANDVLALLGG